MKRLAVYCGSATPTDPRWCGLARDVGAELAQRGIAVVYGGGRRGLMGALADAALAAGGEVIGVIPQALTGPERAHDGLTALEIVTGMHARKLRFTALADGFVTLPGGVGTMDELWEAMSWAQLGHHQKPVGLLNGFGYFDDLIAFNRRMSEVGFVRAEHRELLIVGDTLDTLLERMAQHKPVRSVIALTAEEL